MKKILKLHKTATANRFGTGVLGPDSFSVVFGITEIKDDGFTMVDNWVEYAKGLKYCSVSALPGRISVHWSPDQVAVMYEDTENIHEFLSELAATAIADHYKRGNQQIEEYWYKMGEK